MTPVVVPNALPMSQPTMSVMKVCRNALPRFLGSGRFMFKKYTQQPAREARQMGGHLGKLTA